MKKTIYNLHYEPILHVYEQLYIYKLTLRRSINSKFYVKIVFTKITNVNLI